jgi:hypothetical protein
MPPPPARHGAALAIHTCNRHGTKPSSTLHAMRAPACSPGAVAWYPERAATATWRRTRPCTTKHGSTASIHNKSPRHEGRLTARQRTPPRRLAQRRDAAGLTTLHAGLEARRAFGVKHDGAARGGPQPIPAKLPGHQTWREHLVDAAWGSHGPRLPPARHDAASSMGRRRRDALGSWRLEGTPTDRDKARRRRKGKGWPRRSQRVGGVVVAGSAWAAARRRCRCSRWRPAPVRLLLGHVRLLPRPAPRDLVTPRRRRAGGGAAHRPSPPLLLFSFLPPFLFPFGGAALERGQNPNAGWWRRTTAPCSPPLAFESPGAARQGEIPGLPQLGPPGRPWRRRLPFLCILGHRGMARGQKGTSLPRPGSIRARARPTPRRACRLGDPAVPRPASWCG